MTTPPVKGIMTRWRIALVCAVAGLAVFGANVGIDAVATGFFSRYPDPSFPEPLLWFGVTVACWLIATYLLARREAIRPFGCVFMGVMLWFGFLASTSVSILVIESLRMRDRYYRDDFNFDIWDIGLVALIGVPVAVAVVGSFTAGVGLWMEATIRDHRRKRLSREPAPHGEPVTPSCRRPARTKAI